MNTRTRSGRLLPVGMALIALFFVNGAISAADGPCPADDEKVIRIEITIDYEAGTVAVDKESVEISLHPGPHQPHRVCWVADSLGDNDTLHFDNKDVEGEDEDQGKKYFPQMNRTMRNPPGFINSGNPSKIGTWRYGITVKNSEGEPIMSLDPEVIIGD